MSYCMLLAFTLVKYTQKTFLLGKFISVVYEKTYCIVEPEECEEVG